MFQIPQNGVAGCVILCLVLPLLLGAQCSHRKRDTSAEGVGQFAIALDELSALYPVQRKSDGSLTMAAVGDRQPVAEIFEIHDQKLVAETPIDFSDAIKAWVTKCPSLANSPCPTDQDLSQQWEGLQRDGGGRWGVVLESPPVLLLFTPDGSRLEFAVTLNFLAVVKDKSHRVDAGTYSLDSLAEGFLFMKEGHLLVVKEKDPPLLVEFGPAGSSPLGLRRESLLAQQDAFVVPPSSRTDFAPLRVWPLDVGAGCDVSELAVGEDGDLYGLSDSCFSIMRLPLDKSQPEALKPLEQWDLDRKLIKNPEGLVVLADGFWVGSDVKKGKPNLYWVPRSP